MKIHKKDIEKKVKMLHEYLEMWQWINLLRLWNKKDYINFEEIDRVWRLEGFDEKRFLLVRALKMTIDLDIVNECGHKQYTVSFVNGERKKHENN